MQHARERPARAGADVGRGARDQAGDADAAEQRRADIGDALRHQLAIGAVTASGHAVGDHRRQQRLDGGRAARTRSHPAAPPVAFASENAGSAGDGNSRGMPPKRLPMVSTGSDSAAVAIAASTTAIRMPGQDGRQRRKPAMMAMLTTATPSADGLTVCRPPASAASFGTNSLGSFPASVMPDEIARAGLRR